MTNQKAFDKVVRHLYEMKKQSSIHGSQGPVCAYRGNDGGSCAIGCLIPDHLYNPKMEGTTIIRLVSRFPALFRLFAGVNMFMLASLQRIHDEAGNWNKDGIIVPEVSWKLLQIANDHQLDPGVIHQ